MVCQHQHEFYTPGTRAQAKVLIVFFITLITMFAEILAGYLFNSVALLADGIHMSTHALAFAIAYVAYHLAKKWSKNGGFTFGTWKVEVLGAYTSGILLFFISFLVLGEALSKLVSGGGAKYDEALFVAFLGLGINLISAYILHGEYHHKHHDLNLKGAYLHVLADALTSLLAIVGLLAGKYAGLWFMDPVVGLVGFFIIIKWSFGLMKETAPILLDREGENPLIKELIQAIEKDGKSKVYDIHLLKVHNNKYACIIGLETYADYDLEHYRRLISSFKDIAHLTIELRSCKQFDNFVNNLA